MDIAVLGIDLGKNNCSVVGLDGSGTVILRRRMQRKTIGELTSKLSPCIVAMEACCGAHHLGRVLLAQGHTVRLMSPEYVRPYVKAQKNDDRDAEAIAEAATYTSVPNILKVLNPLFLNDLRTRLEEAGDNPRKLLNHRNRMVKIRVFDPACGSGNFLVIAYKAMREIEAEINKRRGERNRRSEIRLTNFRGIELRDFPAEVARLALIIAEFQCDLLYRGQKEALQDFLPLDAENWITCGNALRLDWLSICPPSGTGVKLYGDDLFSTPLDQAQIDFENEGGETYICGNPPYLGNKLQTAEQKSDLEAVFAGRNSKWKSLDYVAGWFMMAADFGTKTKAASAFVTTNSICQGQKVSILWPLIFGSGHAINFSHTSFKWRNLASSNAVVTVAIVGISRDAPRKRILYSVSDEGHLVSRETENINAYLVSAMWYSWVGSNDRSPDPQSVC
jgi:hypothetical protein